MTALRVVMSPEVVSPSLPTAETLPPDRSMPPAARVMSLPAALMPGCVIKAAVKLTLPGRLSVPSSPTPAMKRPLLFSAFFAVAVISSLSMSLREALFVFALFWGQFILGAVVPEQYHGVERIAVGIVYLLLGAWVLVSERFNLRQLAYDAFRAPYDELAREREADATSAAARRQV